MVNAHIVKEYEKKILVPEGIFERKKKTKKILLTRMVRKDATLIAEMEHLRALLGKQGITMDKKVEDAVERIIYIPCTIRKRTPTTSGRRKSA